MAATAVPPAGQRTYNRTQAAYAIGINAGTIDKLIRTGGIRAVRVGKRILISKEEVERFVLKGPRQEADDDR